MQVSSSGFFFPPPMTQEAFGVFFSIRFEDF